MFSRRRFLAATLSLPAYHSMSALIRQVCHNATMPAVSGDDANAYNIYSLWLRDPCDVSADKGALIAEKTLLPVGNMFVSGDTGSLLTIPSVQRSDYEEAVADMKNRLSEQRILERQFTSDRPYKLVAGEEQKEFQSLYPVGLPRQDPQAPPPELVEKYAAWDQMLSFSGVYFNKSRTLALLLVKNFQSGGAAMNWYVAGIQDGQWRDLRWNNRFLMGPA